MESMKTNTNNRAWIEINTKHLQNNIMQFRRILPKHCKIMAAVKADAYGHGATLVATYLQDAAVTDFCVASLLEGIELRQANITGNILVLSYTPLNQIDDLIAYDLIQTVVDMDYAKELYQTGKKIRVHLGIDTGMHRLGERVEQMEDILSIWEMKNLHLEGVFSHLCVSDSQSADSIAFTKEQIAKFDEAVKQLNETGKEQIVAHLQGSYGVLNYPECEYDYARLGISLYGVLSSKYDHPKVKPMLTPVLSLKSRITCIKSLKEGERAGYGLEFEASKACRIGVVSIGYADGIPRSIASKGYVLIHGKKAPIVGRICMDQLLIDVTQISQVKPFDEVVVIGRQGREEIKVEALADWADTISNEILSRLGKRLERKVVST